MLVALIVIVGLSLLVFAHEAGHFIAAKRLGMKVEEFGFGFPPRIAAWKKGGTEYSVNWLPFGGFVKIAGEQERMTDGAAFDALPQEEKLKLFYFRPAWQRSVVILAGVLMNFIAGWILLSIVFSIGTPHEVIVGGVQSGSPAASAGFEEGDLLKGFQTAKEFIDFTAANKGKEVTIRVVRGTQEKNLTAQLRANPAPGEGSLGVSLAEAGVDRVSPLRALADGAVAAIQITRGTIAAFAMLFKNLILKAAIPAGVVGPVGIFGIAQAAGATGLVPLLQLLALISINLAVLNLIPFPALDGGKFILIIAEKIKGSAISKNVEAAINGIGFVVLILLMVAVTIRDVARLF